MKAPASKKFVTPRNQGGVALVMGLVVLLVMTLLGVSNMNMTSLELRIAGNTQNRNLAFQTADSMLDRIFYADSSDEFYRINFADVEGDGQSFPAATVVDAQGVSYTATVIYMDGSPGKPLAQPIDCAGSSLSLSCKAYEISVTSTHEASNASATQVLGLVKTGPALSN